MNRAGLARNEWRPLLKRIRGTLARELKTGCSAASSYNADLNQFLVSSRRNLTQGENDEEISQSENQARRYA
jgi:hypothetical protein